MYILIKTLIIKVLLCTDLGNIQMYDFYIFKTITSNFSMFDKLLFIMEIYKYKYTVCIV